MADPNAPPSPVWRGLRIFALAVAIVFLVGLAVGFMVAYLKDGGGFGAIPVLVLGGITLGIAECAWLLWRIVRAPRVIQAPGPGEAAEHASQKRWTRLLNASGVLGAITGMTVVVTTHGEGGLLAAPLPVWLALSLVAAWLALMTYATFYYRTQVDELELHANYFGYAIGGGLTILVYPVWYLFWWAELTPEPMHEVLMGLLLVGATTGYLWKKYR